MFWQILLSFMLHATSFGSFGAAAGPLTVSNASAPVPAALTAPTVDSVTVAVYGEQRVPFQVRFGDETTSYDVMAMFVMPNELVPVSVEPESGAAAGYQLVAASGATNAVRDGAWTWLAPSTPGLYPVEVRDRESDQSVTLNVFVMVPYSSMRRGVLNGYRIGNYPQGKSQFYRRPSGFIEVSPGMEGVQVSPHFTLGQFLCKQAGGPTKYLVLRQELLVKLEELLAEVNDRGHEAHTFELLSAYRTPYYNRAIGNSTSLSRHHYGDAADIFVDADDDGRMDDLNRDGRHNLADARWLGNIVEATQDEPEFEGLTGGLGTYRPTGSHGAFVHVDVRGFEARWGA
jgi:hypothetical protein